MDSVDDVMQALAAHDEAVERCGRTIWVGAEPTYTDRNSETPQWLFNALGDDKLQRGQRMLKRIAEANPGAAVLHCVGRQYSGEPCPRWSLGLYLRRDGHPIWQGPPDVLLLDADDANQTTVAMSESFAAALTTVLNSIGLTAATLDAPLANRVVFRTDDAAPVTDVTEQPLLKRPSLHGEQVEGAEVTDSLADSGTYLVVASDTDEGLRIELPRVRSVDEFERLLSAVSTAARQSEVPAILLSGFPPPVDSTVAWTTITPDPAVIEVNMAPVGSATDLLARLRELAAAADDEGLATYRLQYNGVESDSGGGGHITFGGIDPSSSPFLTEPSLLSSLVRYFNRHPSLSYLHAVDSVGSDSQAPRVDETLSQALPELSLALELLSRVENPLPETIWGTLAPFLSDPSGNSHRAEINIEKLANPYLGGRGRLGLVEFRALRMAADPETMASLAALFRAIVAMLAEYPTSEPLIDWGESLHQRFSLPYYLQRDLQEVLADLESHELGLAGPLVERVLCDRHRLLKACELGPLRVELRRAVEFWPLVGDVATQERGGSRLIDSSTSRIEIRMRSAGPESLDDWTVSVGEWLIPLHEETDDEGALRLSGLRYRSFVPLGGLHPTLGAQSPLTLTLSHPSEGTWQITLHEWHPLGEPYPGLPSTIDEARERRAARCVVKKIDGPPAALTPPPAEAVGKCVVDLRWQ
ncbi:transglutaminase domain-containing protein [Rhodopirellula maiorica SM1]|uniref:Transglutaminase domain-containing protein n=1 Tax=Rhodopirellula maiorica SM1 TaxID=1265738 RepID=M5RQA3_9BACT|nr:transglutaminase family protein [Rhodopirellula maiorica]EMI21381.1 transglutaminase domain-containing protein [Rhodopirellula maiorica SM1]